MTLHSGGREKFRKIRDDQLTQTETDVVGHFGPADELTEASRLCQYGFVSPELQKLRPRLPNPDNVKQSHQVDYLRAFRLQVKVTGVVKMLMFRQCGRDLDSEAEVRLPVWGAHSIEAKRHEAGKRQL